MRRYEQGALTRVTVSAREVEAFARRWPCSGLPGRGISFVFDSKNGDLIDLYPDIDGAAVSALADDARRYARRES